ncbi:hypothetical protein U3A55_02465, partial [Salarchaeum sp. III]|uniref:DPP IV N-terminal domain-containing protein n=1 Tax=Salarchaeum sp. III TaxID=3107927 RepID=UPI002EDBA9A1
MVQPAASVKKVQAETLYELEFVGAPQLSPCGQKVAYIQTVINQEKNYESHLFIYDRQTGESVQWTNGASKDSSPKWSSDGKWIAFVSNRSGKNQIWKISSIGGEAKQVTHLKNGASTPVWHPHKQAFLFTTSLKEDETLQAKEGDEEKEELQPLVVDDIRYKGDGIGFLDGRKSQIGFYDLENEQMNLLTSEPYNHKDPAWSPDGEAIAYVRTSEDEPGAYSLQDLLVKPLGKEAYKVNQESGVFNVPNWSPNGEAISYLGHNREYDGATLNRVWMVSLQTQEHTCLTKDVDLECSDVLISDLHWDNPTQGAVWDQSGQGLYVLGTERGNTAIYQIDLSGNVSKVLEGERHI